jgi:hypothetical protein
MTSQLKVDRISPATGSEIIIDGLGGGGLSSRQAFTSSGTWTKTSGVTKVMVEVQGAGGAGGASGTEPTYMNNGSGGGYAKKLIDVSSISTATITIGSGGAGSTSNSGNGADGGNSIWSDGTNTLTGSGGLGARGVAYNVNSLGGVATGGDLNLPGTSGGGYLYSVGASFLGISAPQRLTDTTANKGGKGYGSGGAGSHTGVLNVASGSGADGIVIVTEYR